VNKAKSYLVHLWVDQEGGVWAYQHRPGSLTGNPHELFQKQVRAMWRSHEARGMHAERDTLGLMYAVWPLPEGSWNLPMAMQYAEEHNALANVYVILNPRSWQPVKFRLGSGTRINLP
jgi:hypothetical protein